MAVHDLTGTKRFNALLAIPAGLIVLPFYVALGFLLLLSVTEPDFLITGSPSFTFGHYRFAVADPYNAAVLAQTLWISVLVSLFCTILAFPLAYGFVRVRVGAIRLLIAFAVLLPFMTSSLVRVFAWTTILGREGALNNLLLLFGVISVPRSHLRSDLAVITGQVYFLLPFAVVTMTGLLSRLPPNLERAAQTLGANQWTSFFAVMLPLMRPTIVAAAIISYSLSISAFVVPLLLGGDQYKMYSTLIYDQVTAASNFNRAAAMGIVLVALSLVLILGYHAAMKAAVRRRG